MIKASELHRAAGKALKRVAINDKHLVVEREGYPIAVMVSLRIIGLSLENNEISLYRWENQTGLEAGDLLQFVLGCLNRSGHLELENAEPAWQANGPLRLRPGQQVTG